MRQIYDVVFSWVFLRWLYEGSERKWKTLLGNWKVGGFDKLKHATVNPHAYTEHGVLMLANVLKSDLATQISIHFVKIFVQLRNLLASHNGL